MTQHDLVVVAGGGGFIGGHLVAALRAEGRRIRVVDVKAMDEWYQRFDDVENVVADLQRREACIAACDGAAEVY
jgi:GDP-D-mannose 3', 5'-epimerase